jgi:hypothetical protein
MAMLHICSQAKGGVNIISYIVEVATYPPPWLSRASIHVPYFEVLPLSRNERFNVELLLGFEHKP